MKKQSLKVLFLTMILSLVLALSIGCFSAEEEDELVADPAVAATCTEAGKTEGSHWKLSGEVEVAQTDVPALGHDLAAVIVEGEHQNKCQREGCDYFVEVEHHMVAAHDDDQHWEACDIGECDHISEKVDHTLAEDWTKTATHHTKACSGCSYVESAEHTFSEWVDDPADPMLDTTQSRVCSVCGYTEQKVSAVATGYTYVTDRLVSGISRPEEFVIATSDTDAAAMNLTAYFQLATATTTATEIKVVFVATRDTSVEYDVLYEGILSAGVQTFKVEKDLKDCFIPLEQDAIQLAIVVNGEKQVVVSSAGSTFTGYTNFKNTAAYTYKIAIDASNSSLKFSRDADVIAPAWDSTKFSMSEVEGKPILTVEGTAYINGANASDLTAERTFSIWFINEDATLRGQKLAVTTKNLLAVENDTNTTDFKFEIDLSSFISTGEWYKLVIGIDEGSGVVEKINTAGTGTTIGSGATENAFGDPNTVTVNGIEYRCVSAWNIVHVRV